VENSFRKREQDIKLKVGNLTDITMKSSRRPGSNQTLSKRILPKERNESMSRKGDQQIMPTRTNRTLAHRATRVFKESIANSAHLLVFASLTVALTFASIVSAKHFGDWAAPVNAESMPGTNSELNTTSNEGYPIQSPDGLSLYIVSDRPGGMGGLDIWVASRASTDEPWGAPENLGPTVNSAAFDWSPTPVPGHGLFFVSTRADSCGLDDIYFTRFRQGAWEEPQNVGCQINSTASESGPSYFEDESGHGILYFSSNRAGGFEPGGTDPDNYFSVDFGPAQLAPGLNTASNDVRPNVRKDGREIVFDSSRPGGFGGLDIWTSSRETTGDAWSTPTNLGPLINSASTDARATLSRDGLTMYFGSGRAGGNGLSDIYMTTRGKLKGNER
jgi:hypothetical protein